MAALLASSASADEIADQAVVVEESTYVTRYRLPTQAAPRSIVRVSGLTWFTAPGDNAIGNLSVTSTDNHWTATYTYFPLPTPDGQPYELAWDGTNLWFTALATNKIGKLHVASGVISEYEIPTANSEPTGIGITGDGTIWFVERSGNKLGSFDPATETFSEYLYDRAGAALEDVTIHPSNNVVLFTAPGVNRLVQFNIGTEVFTEVPTASPGVLYTPSQVVVDNNGNPWVSTTEGLIGRTAFATFQYFRWYRVGEEDVKIDGLLWTAAGEMNRLWFTESNTGHAGQLTTQRDGRTVNNWRFPMAGEGGAPIGMTMDADGTVWIADSGNHSLLRWAPPYTFSAHLPIAIKN